MAAVGTVRLHRLAVQLCEPQGRRRLAGAVRHQRALSPPVVVHDGRRGQTGLPGQHLLPIPRWKEYKYVEDYSRLGVMLNQGAPVCDLLIVNPIESVMSQ